MPLDDQAKTEIKAMLEAATASLTQEIQALRQGIVDVPARLTAMEGLLQGFQAAQTPAAPPHVYGLCSDKECAGCVAAAQEIAKPAYQQGRADASQQTEALLVLAGGEELKAMVRARVADGLAIWRNRQPLRVTQ